MVVALGLDQVLEVLLIETDNMDADTDLHPEAYRKLSLKK
jgi:hypothetical protein